MKKQNRNVCAYISKSMIIQDNQISKIINK